MLIPWQIQAKQRSSLSENVPHQRLSYDIRNMSTPQTTLLLAIYDLEETRALRFRPSNMLNYFCNESVNSSVLIGSLEAVAQKVCRLCSGEDEKLAHIALKVLSAFQRQLLSRVLGHSTPPIVSSEICKIIVACTHRMRHVRETAMTFARQIIESFSAVMCDRMVLFTLLEVLTLMRRSCEMQFTDEVSHYEVSAHSASLQF